MSEWDKVKAGRVARMKSGDLSERERRLLDALSSAPGGMALLELCQAAAAPYEQTAKTLNLMRHAGLVDHNDRRGTFSRWCIAGGLDRVAEAVGAGVGPSAKQRAILDFVASSPIGYTKREVCAKFGRSSHTIERHLHELRRLGLLANTAAYFGGVRYARWVVPAALPDAIAYADKCVRNPRRAKREPRKEPRGFRVSDFPQVCVVSASTAKPLRPTGPASVWQLGAMGG